jgi:hypothetical protein
MTPRPLAAQVQLEVFFNTIHLRIPIADDETCPCPGPPGAVTRPSRFP